MTDPDPSNNSATDGDAIFHVADLSITKTDGLDFAVSGQTITYTLVAANPGPSTVYESTVHDPFPAALEDVVWTCVGGSGGSCAVPGGAGDLIDVPGLPPGSTATYTVQATIDAAFTGVLSNTATINPPGAPAEEFDPDVHNNAATDDTIVGEGTGGVLAIPTLSPGGLSLLALLLAAAAVAALGRRREVKG